LRAYKNGTRVETAPTPDTIAANRNLALFAGPSRALQNDQYDGLLDDIRIYQGGLSDSQINEIYLNTEP